MISFEDMQFVGEQLTGHRYIFAKTMPENPHHYTLRKDWQDDEAFDRVIRIMRQYGYKETWKGRPYTQFTVNQYKYWTMGAPINQTILINRKEHLLPTDYDQVAPVYDSLFDDRDSLQENDQVMAMLLAYLTLNRSGHLENQRTLDIGCGTGLLLDYGFPAKQYTGLDPSKSMLAAFLGKHAALTADPPLNLIHARFERFYGGTFDNIVCLFGGVSYIDPDAIPWIPRLLRPGGRFFCMFFKPGYSPTTHGLTGIAPAYYQYNQARLPGEVVEYHNYLIVKGCV